MGSTCSFFVVCLLVLTVHGLSQNGTVYKVGAVLPLSGPLQDSGKIYLDAYTMVIQLFNDLNDDTTDSPFNSLLGYNGTIPFIELAVLDDESVVEVSVRQVQQLASSVDAILGGVTTDIVAAQVNAANNLSIPLVNGGGAASAIYYSEVPWAFGVMSSIQQLANSEMVMLKDLVFRGLLPRPCKCVLISENSLHGTDFRAGVLSFLNKTENNGYFTLSADYTFVLDQQNWNDTVNFISEAYHTHMADILLVDVRSPDFVNIQRELDRRSNSIKYKLVSFGPIGGEVESVVALSQALNGLVFGTWWSAHFTNTQSEIFKSAWGKFHPSGSPTPDYRAACAYEAARALLTAVAASGTLVRRDVRQALANLYLRDSLFLGEQLLFNPIGQASYDFAFEQVSYANGTFSTNVISPVSIKQTDPAIFYPIDAATTTTGSGVIVITKNGRGMELWVGIGGGVGLVVLAMILYAYFYRKRHSVPDLEKGGAPPPEPPSPLPSRRKKKLPQGSRSVTHEEFPLVLSDWNLHMGLESNQCPVEEPVTQTITLTNNLSQSIRFRFRLPEPTHKATLTFSPSSGKIKKGHSAEVEAKIVFSCTAKWATHCFVTATMKDETKVHSPIAIKLESMLSTKLSYDEITTDGPAIGEGTYGSVFQGEWRGMPVAVKKLKVQEEISYPEAFVLELQKEVDMMTRLRHPNIVNFVGASLTSGHLCIVTEFMPLGSLGKYLNPKCNLRTLLKAKIALDCARGMAFLHQCNILHRDLKPDNLLVVSMSRHAPINVKLTDFGTARAVTLTITKHAKMTMGLGTPVYMAPEVLSGSAYDVKSDVFSFAIFLYELITQSDSLYKEFNTQWGVAKFVAEGNRMEIPPQTPPFFVDLITKCWAQAPADRPKFSEIVEELEHVLQSRKGIADSQSLVEEPEKKKKPEGEANNGILAGLSSIFNLASPSVSNINIPNAPSPSEPTELGPRHGPRLQRKRRPTEVDDPEFIKRHEEHAPVTTSVSFKRTPPSLFPSAAAGLSPFPSPMGTPIGSPAVPSLRSATDSLRKAILASPLADTSTSPREHMHDIGSGDEHDDELAACHVCRSRSNSKTSSNSSKSSSTKSTKNSSTQSGASLLSLPSSPPLPVEDPTPAPSQPDLSASTSIPQEGSSTNLDVEEAYFSRELRYQQHSDGSLDRTEQARTHVGTEFPGEATEAPGSDIERKPDLEVGPSSHKSDSKP